MSKYQLKIELLSDLCVSDGGVYNSSVDTDVCHDIWGFPYIPAKRIRGCLRECAVELSDWGMELPWEKMFGHEGRADHQAAVRIGDAYLEDYEKMKSLAQEHSDKVLFHTQNILKHFTYLRTQTSLNYETGVADETSLRTMRVVNKGLKFRAEVRIRDEGQEKVYKNALEQCCDILTEMGVARTRGLGQVHVTLEPMTDVEQKPLFRHKPYKSGSTVLEYELYLEEPVICKSVNGGEAWSLDYIEGSKMLGLVIGEAKSQGKDFLPMMEEGELFCSNAYLSENGKRYTEIPAVIYSVKNDSAHYVNKLYPDPDCVREEHLQLNMMKHSYGYIDKDRKLYKKSVEIEERYHHRRPEDKGVGRAMEEESGNSQFYQMSSIEAGQTMKGYFSGTESQIRAIYEILSQEEVYYIGYSRSSEYGKIRLSITDLCEQKDGGTKKVKDIYVKLEAPTIIYNDRAFYSTDAEDLIGEIAAELGVSKEWMEKAQVQRFVRYTTVGGYNTQWNRPKPIITAFDKGTVLRFSWEEEVEITIPSLLLLGERVTEGFGEATVRIIHDGGKKPEDLSDIDLELGRTDSDNQMDAAEEPFVQELCEDLFDTYIRHEAMTAAQEKEKNISTADRPTVSNMLQMCRENDTFSDIRESCNERFKNKTNKKQAKSDCAEKILQTAETASVTLVEDFCNTYRIKNFVCNEEKLCRTYLESYLTQMKYMLRQTEQGEKGGEK